MTYSGLGDPGTFYELLSQTSRLIQGSHREPVDVLASAISTNDTVVTLTDGNELAVPGSWIAIGDEPMYVIDRSNLSLTVRRGSQYGYDVKAWDAFSPVQVDWRWFLVDIAEATVDEVRSWPTDLFQVRTADVAVSSSGVDDLSFDCPLTGFTRLLSMRINRSGETRWPKVKGDVVTGLPTASFASGNALFLDSNPGVTATVRVTYAAQFILDTFLLTDLISTYNITTTMRDIIKYGTAARLLINAEPMRTSMVAQPEPRSGSEVRPGDAARQASVFKSFRDERIAQEVARLQNLYPMTF